jgi:hypothetical protein
MINNKITSWTQPVGSEIKGDKHGDNKAMGKLFIVNYNSNRTSRIRYTNKGIFE